MTACCSDRFSLCMLQGADKTFLLTDHATADFSDATEITLDVWPNAQTGTALLSYSLTGGELSQPTDYQIGFSIPNADSTTLAAGSLYAETWITFSDGTRVGAKGTLKIEDTRKHD